MKNNVSEILAYVAVVGVWIRFWPYIINQFSKRSLKLKEVFSVSLIIPARNEANKISKLLDSLLHLDYPAVEIIVVDDGSTDHTRQIAEQYPVKVLSTPPKPHGWVGKSWACHIGAMSATGKYILFTDADTIHKPDSLKKAVAFLQKTKSKMISAPPFHINKLWWEKLLGPFFCLIHAGASPYDRISIDHPYALGQYLLLEKEFYHKIGGHVAVHNEVADDASLAKLVIANKGKFSMFAGVKLCEVQMYESFEAFIKGWLRILRLGIRELKPSVFFYTLLPLLTLNLANLFPFELTSWIPLLLTLICFALVQPKLGNFTISGLIVFPVSFMLFLTLSCWAAVGHLFNLPILWSGRLYIPEKKITTGNV
ncbi:glycosyltransferase [Chryseosolibacter indicus]|uniref:Glycosyltransferase n=1 Tax=Chryseosolibacter indicus TaxID=2782351 RepID=A0ABS5VP01_9BACT|nr:glycosyltransferase [Chryseosolibacter indicus]MBT1701731.1 glycosyltransferase [Chryseosolibacter indicus]